MRLLIAGIMNIYEQIINTLTPLDKDYFTTGEIRKLVNEKFGTEPSSIMPYDYCYNRTNRGVKFDKHIFIFLERGKYRFVGEGYPYNGLVYHRAVGESKDRVVGKWVDGVFSKTFKYAEEITDDEQEFTEGTKQRITVNKYERDPKARAECIRIHGHICKVCGFDFEKIYGDIGRGYIHVHHILPLKDIGDHYIVNPAKDMIPVCPNCHAMLHKLDDPGDVDMLKGILNR